MTVNYHNHTALCGHATGEMADYIRAASSNGVAEFGFADHAPIPEHLRRGVTMSPEQVELYIGRVLDAKTSFRDVLDIKLGFEADFPLFDSFQKRYLTDPRVDFIIGSVHFIGEWAFDNPSQISGFSDRDIDQVYSEYYSIVEAAVDSQFCDIIGHFDLVKKFGHRPYSDMTGIIERVARKMSHYGIVAEINTAGLIKPVGEIYPSDEIIGIFFRENVPVTLGSDSHSPEEVCGGYPLAISMLKKAGYRKISGFTHRKRHELPL